MIYGPHAPTTVSTSDGEHYICVNCGKPDTHPVHSLRDGSIKPTKIARDSAPTLTAVPVRAVGFADGASCRDCGVLFGRLWPESVPWTWRQSQSMHQKGTGHKMDLFRVEYPKVGRGELPPVRAQS